MMTEQDIKDKLTKVCLCIGVNKLTIKNAIREGATSPEEVSKKTHASTGSCKGSRCREKIKELIKDYQDGIWK